MYWGDVFPLSSLPAFCSQLWLLGAESSSWSSSAFSLSSRSAGRQRFCMRRKTRPLISWHSQNLFFICVGQLELIFDPTRSQPRSQTKLLRKTMFAQRICGCPIPVRAQGQAGRGCGQPRLGGWHPCPGQGVGWSLMSLPTPVPQFCDFSCFSLAAPRHCGQGGREDKEPEAKSDITLCSGSRVLCSGAVQEAVLRMPPSGWKWLFKWARYPPGRIDRHS